MFFEPANHGRQSRESPRTISNAFRRHRHKLMARGFARQIRQQEFAGILRGITQVVRNPADLHTICVTFRHLRYDKRSTTATSSVYTDHHVYSYSNSLSVLTPVSIFMDY